MADDNVKQLVAEFTLDTSGWAATVQKVRNDLRQAASDEQARAAIASAAAKQAIADITTQTAKSNQQAAAAKATAAAQQAQAAAIQTAATAQAAAAKAALDQTTQSKAQAAAAASASAAKRAAIAAETEALRKKIALEELETKELQKQLNELRLKNAEAKEAAEGGMFTKLTKGVAGGLFGKGGAGFAGALLGGTAGAFAGEAAIEGIEKLIDKIKEFVEDSGSLQKVTQTFDSLAKGRGTNAEEFLDGLLNATHRLVPEVDLLRTANTFMQSGLKVSTGDMLKLTQATVGLARAQGSDATQALQALNRAFLTGRAQQLAYVTGIQRWQLQIKGLGPNVDQATRSQKEFEQVMAAIQRRYTDLGEPALTYTDRLKQLSVTTNELFEDLAQGAVKSSGFTVLMESFGKFVDGLGGLEPAARKIGAAIGDAISPVAIMFSSLGPVVKSVADEFTSIATLVHDQFKSSMDDAGASTEDATKKFAQLHPILALVAKTFAYTAGVIRQGAADIKYFADTLDAFSKDENNIPKRIGQNLSDAKSQFQAGNYGQSFRSAFIKGSVFDSSRNNNKGYDTAYQNWQQSTQGIQKDVESQVKVYEEAFQKAGDAIQNDLGSNITTPRDTSLDRKNALQEAKARQDEQIKAAQDWLAQDKEIIDQEKQANEDMYRSGQESAKQYYDTKRNLALQSLQNTLIDIERERKARQDELDIELNLGQITKPVYNSRTQGLNEQTQGRIAKANQAYNKENNQIDTQQQQDQIAARVALIKTEQQAATDAIKEQEDQIKAAYKEELISGQDYVQQRLLLIQEDLQNTVASEQQKLLANKQTAAAQQAYLDAIMKKQADVRKQMSDLNDEALNDILNDTQRRFGGALSSNQSIGQMYAVPGLGSSSQTRQLQQQQKDILDQQITALTQLAAQAQPYSDTWNKIVDSMVKATTQQQQLNNEMERSASFSQNVAGLFGTMAQEGQGIFKGSFGQKFLSSLGQGSQSLQQSFDLNKQLKSQVGGGPALDPRVQAVVDAASASGNALKTAGDEASSGLDVFTQQLQRTSQLLGELGDAAQKMLANTPGAATGGGSAAPQLPSWMPTSIPYAPSTHDLDALFNTPSGTGTGPKVSGQGGGNIFSTLKQQITGLISGQGSFQDLSKTLQVGVQAVGSFVSTIANAQNPLGGAFGGAQAGAGLGSSFGPIGTAVGAAGGALLGAIAGNKQEQIHQDIVDLENAALKINLAMSSGTASLSATITAMQNLIAQAQEDAASSKKGNSQFEALIKQYTQQLDQLEAQAAQTMQQLKEQMDVLASPNAYQQWVQNIEQVLDQYKQFAGAAQNAQELGQANQYLVQSLQNIGLQMGQQLQQDEETAVQNALDLNTALMQRNALEKQYLDQVHSIMSQGSLTRTTTLAQQKFSQLYDASAQFQMQMDQMNQQVALDQAQVAAAQQVFNLAQTRQGLEQQLLTLQSAGIQQDMQRISAMQNLLGLLSRTGYSITNLGGVNPNDPNSLVNQLLAALLGGIPGAGTGNLTLQQLLGVLGQSGGLGNATNPIAATGYIPAATSPLESLAAVAYNQRAAYGYGGYNGANL